MCREFCNELYTACKKVPLLPSGERVGSRWKDATEFCLAQNVSGFGVDLHEWYENHGSNFFPVKTLTSFLVRESCFKGFKEEANTDDLGLCGNLTGLEGGLQATPNCFTVQVEDFFDNPKQIVSSYLV